MTEDEHKAHHCRLHEALDELVADWISHQPLTAHALLSKPIYELMKWSHAQTIKPTPPKNNGSAGGS